MLWLALHFPQLSLESFGGSAAGQGSGGAAAVPDPSAAALSGDPLAQRPLALQSAHRITQVNAAARAMGVQAGMKRATALALAGDLLVGQADVARDAAALLAAAHVALAFTPEVVLAPGHTVLLQVQASLRLFGGLPALLLQLNKALIALWPPMGHRVHVAAAPTAVGAALLAHWSAGSAGVDGGAGSSAAGAGANGQSGSSSGGAVDWIHGPHASDLEALALLLDQAPLTLLAAGQAHAVTLQGMGLSSIGELRSLPRAGLTRRFGTDLLLELDRALGLAADPRQSLVLPEVFEARLELAHRADTSAQVLAAAALLLARLVAWAQARQVRILAFSLQMRHEPRHGRQRLAAIKARPAGTSSTSSASSPASTTRTAETFSLAPADEDASVLRVEMAEPSVDASHLQLLLRERLAAFVLPAPTLELRLFCNEVRASAAPNGELFPARQAQALGLARLLERLRARLGEEGVQRLEPLADHRPERASQSVPALQPNSATRLRATTSAARSTSTATPVTLAGALPTAPAAYTASSASSAGLSQSLLPLGSPALPLHQPLWLLPEPLPLAQRGARPLWEGQPLRLLSGPERIETGWWDGALAARDYYIAMAPGGALLWLWRQRLAQGRAGGAATWMLQGRFG